MKRKGKNSINTVNLVMWYQGLDDNQRDLIRNHVYENHLEVDWCPPMSRIEIDAWLYKAPEWFEEALINITEK